MSGVTYWYKHARASHSEDQGSNPPSLLLPASQGFGIIRMLNFSPHPTVRHFTVTVELVRGICLQCLLPSPCDGQWHELQQ